MKKRVKKVKVIDLLVNQYPDTDRSVLLSYIASKQVSIDGEGVRDSWQLFPSTSTCVIQNTKYVSRGGLKLEKALIAWGLDVNGLVFVDAGSSTGGFTDCLLQNGAQKVHCVDVGYNQLDWRLRVDQRVIVHEKTNIMHILQGDIEVDAAVADLSFRSISGAASHILSLTNQKWMISLIKPQFEIEGSREDFSGVITDNNLLYDTLISVYRSLENEDIGIKAIINSPIRGRKGNREFLAMLVVSQGLSIDQFKQEIEILIRDTEQE